MRVNRILPAFKENHTCFLKVEEFAAEMRANDLHQGHHGFPPILGFYDEITEEDIGEYFLPTSNEAELITKDDLGTKIFRVTDGNHRFFAAIKAGICALETEIDKSGFVIKP